MTFEIFWSYIISTTVSFILIPLVNKIALNLKIYAHENKRTIHHGVIARLGGLGIYLAFMLCATLFLKADTQINAILIAGFVIFSLGYFDDIYELSPKVKLLFQAIAALIVIYGGDIYLREIDIPVLTFLDYKPIRIFITFIWIVGVTNAINLIDGLDGLCAGVSIIVLVVIAFTSVRGMRTDIALISILLAGSISGFLFYNFHPASIFMGDSGSLFIGFMISCISLLGFGYKTSAFFTLGAPIVMLAIPIMDTLAAILRRKLKGKSFSEADREHLHHALMFKLELGQTRSVLILYMTTILFGISAYVFTYNDTVGFVMFLSLVVIFELFIEYSGMISVHYKPLLSIVNLFLNNPKLPMFSAHRKYRNKNQGHIKNYQKNMMVVISLMVTMLAVGIAIYTAKFDGQPAIETQEVLPEVSLPSYPHESHETPLMKSIYVNLTQAVEDGDDVAIKTQVASYFAADFFTLRNKEDATAIGGLMYVSPHVREDFEKYAKNYYYANIEELKRMYGQNNLCAVKDFEVVDIQPSNYIDRITENDDSYDVILNLNFEGELPELFSQTVLITVLHVDDYDYVVDVECVKNIVEES